MADILFVLGPQRSGTTITARVLGAHPDVAPGGVGHCPYARWDVQFMAEVGGNPDRQPLLTELRKTAYHNPSPYYLCKVALPVSAESLLWPRLLEMFHKSSVVLTDRDSDDTTLYASAGGGDSPKCANTGPISAGGSRHVAASSTRQVRPA